MNTYTILFSIAGIAVVLYFTRKMMKSENYKDPLWMEPPKLARDYYTRSNGSIYGDPQPNGDVKWNMFSGLNSNDTAL